MSEDDKLILAYIKKMNMLAAGQTHECPVCSATVLQMRQSGRSVYLEPCGHRLWQGLVPDYWKHKR